MSAATGTKKHFDTKPVATAKGPVVRQLERDALDDVLQSMEAAHGVVDEDEVAGIVARLAE